MVSMLFFFYIFTSSSFSVDKVKRNRMEYFFDWISHFAINKMYFRSDKMLMQDTYDDIISFCQNPQNSRRNSIECKLILSQLCCGIYFLEFLFFNANLKCLSTQWLLTRSYWMKIRFFSINIIESISSPIFFFITHFWLFLLRVF